MNDRFCLLFKAAFKILLTGYQNTYWLAIIFLKYAYLKIINYREHTMIFNLL